VLKHANITLQHVGARCEDPQNGRLKVVPVRDFSFNVPYEFSDGKHSYEEAPNPVNQLGGLIADHVPVVTSNDFGSFLAAFNKRCNFAQAGAEDDISDKSFHAALDIINALPNIFESWDDNDHDRSRWMNKFDVHKQKRMSDAYANVDLSTYKYVGTKDLSVKQETLMKRNDDTWAPRIIYAGNDAFNTITGPAAMVVMERFCHLTSSHKVGPIKVKAAYKTTDVELMEFILDDQYTHTVEGDFSRNDREQRSRVALIYDCWLQKLGMPNWYRKLNLELENYIVQSRNFGFRAKLKYQLPTGTTNTTPRNTLYNSTMFAVVCTWQKRTGKALVLGDDLLARLNQRLDIKLWVTQVATFKMVLKGKEPKLEGEATFLSRRIILNTATPCMVPLIGKMIARFNARGTSNAQCSDEDYMAGKALSYAFECRHVKWLRDFFLRRYNMVADVRPVFDELSWFTRTSGYDSLDSIVEAIQNERVLVHSDEFDDWLYRTYESDTYELEVILNATILNPNLELVQGPARAYFDKYKFDVE
jgi:hypothetical protein